MALLDSAAVSMDDLPAANVTDAVATEVKHNVYVETIAKRTRAMKKRVLKIEKYEHNNPKTLNADQTESLRTLPGLRGAIKELEELIKVAMQLEAEESRQLKKTSRHAVLEKNALIAKNVGEANRKANERLKFYALLMSKLMTLDQDDAIVIRIRDTLCGDNVHDELRKVMERREEKLDGIDVSYQQVHDTLLPPELVISDETTEENSIADNTTTIVDNNLTSTDTKLPTTTADPEQTKPWFIVDSLTEIVDDSNNKLDNVLPSADKGIMERNVNNNSNHNLFSPSTLSFMSGEDLIHAMTATQDKVNATAELLKHVPFENTTISTTPIGDNLQQQQLSETFDTAPAADADISTQKQESLPLNHLNTPMMDTGEGGKEGAKYSNQTHTGPRQYHYGNGQRGRGYGYRGAGARNNNPTGNHTSNNYNGNNRNGGPPQNERGPRTGGHYNNRNTSQGQQQQQQQQSYVAQPVKITQ